MERTILLFLMLFYFILSNTSLNGQNRLKGSVYDQNGRPIQGAIISLDGNIILKSNAQGLFVIDSLNKGQHILSLKYKSGEQTCEIIAEGKERTIEFTFKEEKPLDEIIINGVRIGDRFPTAKTHISKKDFQKFNTGEDLVYLLDQSPSVNVFSDTGAGVGFSGIRIRGSDGNRTNVTINGVPVNDSESQGVFWDNMPDLSSSVQNVQIQRGAGSSTNGAGAFGASIHFMTETERDRAYAEAASALGSFATQRHTIKLGSGWLKNFQLQSKLSYIATEGYVQRAYSKMYSATLSGTYRLEKSQFKLVALLGDSKNYQAWNGVDKETLNKNRRFNTTGAIYDKDDQITSFYENQINKYKQDHYQLLFSHRFNPYWNMTHILHHTYGRGYYEEYRQDEKFKEYRLSPITISTSQIENTDLVRRRWLDNNFYGLISNFQYKKDLWEVQFGAAYNQYTGDHFGKIIWARFASDSGNNKKYYHSRGKKEELSTYAKATYGFTKQIYGFADIQYRYINYKAFDIDNLYIPHAGYGPINIFERFCFLNPRAGMSYLLNKKHKVSISYALAQREPQRDDYYKINKPKTELLHDFELGHEYKNNKWSWQANAYYMLYKNQMVLSGGIDISGAPIRKNSGKSYRLGLELSSKYNITANFSWQSNLTLSINENQAYYTSHPDGSLRYLSTSDISYSPSVIGFSSICWQVFKKLEISLQSKYTGAQNMTNENRPEAKLKAFLLHDIFMKYDIPLKGSGKIESYLHIKNLLNTSYESNGYFSEKAYYFPQAGIHFLMGIRAYL